MRGTYLVNHLGPFSFVEDDNVDGARALLVGDHLWGEKGGGVKWGEANIVVQRQLRRGFFDYLCIFNKQNKNKTSRLVTITKPYPVWYIHPAQLRR